jgi:nitroreductase
MNPKLSPLFARRSVRRYQDREVPDGHVHDLLEAGMAAPSAAAKDPWHFVVVRRKEMLGRLADGLPHGQMLRHAALGIVVCGDLRRAHGGEESYLLQDCSAATENILLAASLLGLGACWLGVHPRQDRIRHVREVLGVPAEVVPVSVVALGWPAETPPPRTRYAEAAVHRETW